MQLFNPGGGREIWLETVHEKNRPPHPLECVKKIKPPSTLYLIYSSIQLFFMKTIFFITFIKNVCH